jgi:CheY-specific phosphatase CheX
MRFEYIKPFVASTAKVLNTVIQSDIAQGDIALVMYDRIDGDIAILIRLDGNSEGNVILNMNEETALKISNAMNGSDYDSLTPLGMDSISELANIIAGNTTSVLNEMGFDFLVSTPLIVTKNDLRDTTSGLEVFQIPFSSKYGKITLNVALRTN